MTLSAAAQRRIEALRGENPSFIPWLTVVELALEALPHPAWEAAAREATLREVAEDQPALEGASFVVDGKVAGELVARLAAAAAQGEGLGALRAPRELDPARWLSAALDRDRGPVDALAESLYVDTEKLAPLVELAAMPLLFAAGRRCGERAKGWSHGFCPVCGGWPSLAELRGLDRARRLRCGHCAADWGLNPLLCVYCGNEDHKRLVALVPEKGRESRRVDACHECRGYVKAVAQLTPIAPELLPLEDLASVELDLVALEREYHRPEEARRARARVRVR